MKKIKLFSIVVTSLVIVSMFAGCSKKSDSNPVGPTPTPIVNADAQITLNGAGYNNQTVNFSNGLCGYSVQDTATAVYFTAAANNDSLQLYIVFKGNHTGTFNSDTANGVILYKATSNSTTTFIGVANGSTTVNSYGAVGDKVSGSINGQLIDSNTQATLSISGTFSAARIPDTQ